MKDSNLSGDLHHNGANRHHRALLLRAVFLFADFFLIITAYYQLKPASRSLFIEHLGADYLPYVWILTAVVLGAAMFFYHRWVARYPRDRVVLVSCWLFAGLLVLFWLAMLDANAGVAVAFYVFVDIIGVVLVEQFWSLANSLYNTHDGKRWYGIVGTGGLVGGVAGGGIANAVIRYTPLQTPDLLLVAAGIICLIIFLTMTMKRLGLYRESDHGQAAPAPALIPDWHSMVKNHYLVLIAALLLLAQLAQPVVEFQFLKLVETGYTEREARTAFLSAFFSAMGLVSIGVNLVLTPVVHRLLGVIAGLLVQPLALGVSSLVFIAMPALGPAMVMKICDRGLSYSINRASKELLYVPIDSVLIYQAKAWIDMLGYRIFKVIGSLLILLFTQWLPWAASVAQLGWLTIGICIVWGLVILTLRLIYRNMVISEAGPPAPAA
jgi:AAA family ATP:ADP antiporter